MCKTDAGRLFSSLQGTYQVHGQTPAKPVWYNHSTQWAQNHRQQAWKKSLRSIGFPASISLFRCIAWLTWIKQGFYFHYQSIVSADRMFTVYSFQKVLHTVHTAENLHLFPLNREPKSDWDNFVFVKLFYCSSSGENKGWLPQTLHEFSWIILDS